jgi:hypothetical protein
MLAHQLFRQYQDLQAYVEWDASDVERVRAAGKVVEPHFAAMIDDFYAELVRHPAANSVVRGGGPADRAAEGIVARLAAEFVP